MSDKVVPFNKENEDEQCCCPSCDLAFEYLEYFKIAKSDEELFNVIKSLISDAGDLELKNYLVQEIGHKMELLDQLEGCCDEDCDC
jgi:hypothetical protein